MAIERRELYRSANGDRWYLARDTDTEHVFVQHQANAPSGGQIEDVEVGAFLIGPPGFPERRALLELIGGFVDQNNQAKETISVEKLNSSNDE
jgi:hypothetical protein